MSDGSLVPALKGGACARIHIVIRHHLPNVAVDTVGVAARLEGQDLDGRRVGHTSGDAGRDERDEELVRARRVGG